MDIEDGFFPIALSRADFDGDGESLTEMGFSTWWWRTENQAR
jgi:hypothetical protein